MGRAVYLPGAGAFTWRLPLAEEGLARLRPTLLPRAGAFIWRLPLVAATRLPPSRKRERGPQVKSSEA